ncbi:hypothetical protein CALCODRAFT_487944 [Calocera cornea HHB12733]|uniref:DUF6532 domain-containing protein n=1 Tax=Calocera cornea HHB12733 TaxID=1353952 RepID=A0A165CU08_9BASI|nr:hypothetical protein CALCODRAFT_487944 [Calocera cornea HHB12733]
MPLTSFTTFYPVISDASGGGALRFGPPQHDVSFLASSITTAPLSSEQVSSATKATLPASAEQATSARPPTAPGSSHPPRTSSGPSGYFARQVANAQPTTTGSSSTRSQRPTSAANTRAPNLTLQSDDSYNPDDDATPSDSHSDMEIEYTGSKFGTSRSTRSPTDPPGRSKRRRLVDRAEVKPEPVGKSGRKTRNSAGERASHSAAASNNAPTRKSSARTSRNVHDPPDPTPPEKVGDTYTLKNFCREHQDTIQDAKIILRLQYYSIYLYADEQQKQEFLDTAILLANKAAEVRWLDRMSKGDPLAINGTLQGTARTLASPLIAHYGPWGRTVLKEVAQSVVKQCYSQLTDTTMQTRQRKDAVALLLEENSFLFREVEVVFDTEMRNGVEKRTRRLSRHGPFGHPAVKAMIRQSWFGTGKHGDGHRYPELFLAEREPDGAIAAASAALLFALRQYQTGNYVDSIFNETVFKPEYDGIRRAVAWYKEHRRGRYEEILLDLLDVASQTVAQQAQAAQASARPVDEQEEADNFLAHDIVSD